jgi:beta-N-acetylhexosaminidase
LTRSCLVKRGFLALVLRNAVAERLFAARGLRYTPGVRTRLFLLALVLSVASLGRPPALAQEPVQAGSDLVDALLQSLSPREKIEQLIIVGFQGPELSPEARAFIADNKVGGVFLSPENCNIVNGTADDPVHCDFPEETDPDTPAQVARLSQQLQEAACEASTGSAGGGLYCLPLFITVDHEGDGRPSTRLLNRFTPIPSNMAIGATFDASQAEAVGCIVGQELAAVGVNMLFGPDLDVLDSPRSGGPGDQGIRVFGGDPRWVAEMGVAYIRGVETCGGGRLATVAKHFPGHGRSTRQVDYEDVPVVVGKTLEELAQVDLAPFAAVSRGKPGDPGVTDGIMNSHLSYPGVAGCDSRTPVTFSPSCMQTFMGLSDFSAWREAGGLTVADDLAAGAVQAYALNRFGTYRQGDVALEALMAGNDLLPLIRPWQWQDLEATVDYLVSRYEVDSEVRERVDDAVRRVLALKQRLYQGLEPAVITGATDRLDVVGLADSASQVESIAEDSVTFIRPSSLEEFRTTLPAPTLGQKILFVECWDDPTCSAPSDLEAYQPLWPRGKLASLVADMFPGRVSQDSLKTISFSELGSVLRGTGDGDVRQAVEEADWLVFAFLERDPSGFPDSEVLKDFLGRGPTLFDLRSKKVVVFAYNSPYHLDAGELRNVDLFIALYSKIEPSLRASLRVLFQDPTILRGAAGRGSLPVDYVYGDYVLYDLNEQVKASATQHLQLTVEPSRPVAGQNFTVSLAQPLLSNNGHRVPNDTEVSFVFQLPDGGLQEVSALTTDGIAGAGLTSPRSGEVQVTVKSGEFEWTAPQPIVVLPPGAGAGTAESLPGAGAAAGGGGGFPVPLAVSLATAALVAVAAGTALVLYVGRRRRELARVTVGPQAQARPGGQDGPVPEEEELRLDLATHRLFVMGKEVKPPLSREQYELLAHLYEKAGKLCSREEIIRRVWPDVEAAGVSEEAVDSLVHRVRERLRAAGASKELIVTVRGQGFRLDL